MDERKINFFKRIKGISNIKLKKFRQERKEKE